MNILKYFYHILLKNGLSLVPNPMEHISIYKEWKTIKQTNKNLIDLRLPWITISAKKKIIVYLNKIENPKVFEYGVGGSSLFFIDNGASLVSIEHDNEWYLKLKKSKLNNKFDWQILNIPPETITHNRLYASSFKGYENSDFFNYVSSIDSFDDSYFDLILIDGRSRVACLKHAKGKVKIGGWIVLDNAERSRYFEEDILVEPEFKCIYDHYGALIGSYQFVKTNIYQRIK